MMFVVGLAVIAAPTTPAAAQGGLGIELFEDPFVCNGGTRIIGNVTGLTPLEKAEFSSPQVGAGGVFSTRDVDETGTIAMRWTCDAAKVWEVTVRGVSSGRTATFNITGLASAPGGVQPPLGAAFDAKSALSIEQMAIWKDFSPYNGVGIYIDVNSEWDNRADKDQVHLNSAWVDAVLADGWRILPIYVGRQAPASCETASFYNMSEDGATARTQGQVAAADAVASMQALGLGAGEPIYYDMEGYRPGCGRVVISFLEGWTEGVRAAGYISGVYGSQNSVMTDLTAAARQGGFVLPDAIWVSTDGRIPGTLGLRMPPDDLWTNARIHQYYLDVTRTYGGITVAVDDNIVDGPVAEFRVPIIDNDGDGVGEPEPDNCDSVANPTQIDLDGDGDGDACDNDVDGDGIADPEPDNCDRIPNPSQADFDGDGDGDVCDADIDGDFIANVDDPDIDGDFIANVDDPAPTNPLVPNASNVFNGGAPAPTPTPVPPTPAPEPTAASASTAVPEPEPTPEPDPEQQPQPTAVQPPPQPTAPPEPVETPQSAPAEPAAIVLPTVTPAPESAVDATPTPPPTPTPAPTSPPTPEPEGVPEGGVADENAGVLIINEPEGVDVPWRPIALAVAGLAAVGFTIGGIRSYRGGGKDPWAR